MGLTCAAPSGHCCYTWGHRAVWCGWDRSEAGARGSGPQAQLQQGLTGHKQDGLALHRALLSASMGSLSSAGNSHPPALPTRLREVGEREGSVPGPEPWLASQAVPALVWPFICDHLPPPLPPIMSSLLLALRQASQVTFLGHRPLTFLWHPLASVHLGSSHPPASAQQVSFHRDAQLF